mmetsp:Transcript_265/g.895  ORF Transcript_265/g.895 Transcript_265/m.895 type:complete len:279 (+) Transcript_265:45-881(+)
MVTNNQAAKEALAIARRGRDGSEGGLFPKSLAVPPKPPRHPNSARAVAGQPFKPPPRSGSQQRASGSPRAHKEIDVATPTPRRQTSAEPPQTGQRPSGEGANRPGIAAIAEKVRPNSAAESEDMSSRAQSRASSAGPRPGRDFIAENRAKAAGTRPRCSSAQRREVPLFTRDGSNKPLYLHRVKLAVEKEHQVVVDRLGLGRNDGVPAGCRLLSEAERLDTLQALQVQRASLQAEFSRLPLQLETPSQQQKAKELERQVQQVEEHIKVFSSHQVVVKE